MKNILLIGAGKSAGVLIEFLLSNAAENKWHLHLADLSLELAEQSLNGHPCGSGISCDVNIPEQRSRACENKDLIISLLPARFHFLIAKEALARGIDFFTASYRTPELEAMEKEVSAKGLLFLNEMGLDPGIDHMSAIATLDILRGKNAKIHAFETFTGGLVAEGSHSNPWNYKFTWNPRNVVLAGQGVVKFKHNGRYKYIPYSKLFQRYEMLEIPKYGTFEGYPNRNSLKYRKAYGLENVDTIYRGTMRRPGFCAAWDVFVQLGMTDDSYELEDLPNTTWRQYINSFLRWHPSKRVEEKLCEYLGLDRNGAIMKKLQWLGIFEHKPIGLGNGSPAKVLQHLLERKWSLDEEDRDMIVMLHKFDYEIDGLRETMQSSMVVLGEESGPTAMAKTVGLPLGIAAKLRLNEEWKSLKGTILPTEKKIYTSVLPELDAMGINFKEEIIAVG